MLCALIALLCALLAAESKCTSKCVTSKCTAKACFTLHTENATFENASANCNDNGGYLVTIRDTKDLKAVKSLLSSARKDPVGEKVWIGLKLSKGSCVLSDQRLHGFRWTSGAPNSSYTNWRKEPRSTCTEERCVSLSTSTDELKWSDGSCKERVRYMCVYYFKGMCEPLVLAGAGEVNYTLPFLKVPVKQDGRLAMLPHATFADISCAYGSESNTFLKCNERDGHFVWEKPGPFCTSSQRSCRNRNGGCSQRCIADSDAGVRCECNSDYYLGEDNVTCLLKDPCHKSPCSHKCASKGTGFECTCPEGFALSEDKVSCKDVDECIQGICNGHMCHNKQGGYACECRKGFKDVGGVCEDIDECAMSLCAHPAKCLNSQGSFSCSCSPGYKKYGDQCVDIDECQNRPCESICSNTQGSYTCSCGAGFRLAENGISCVPDRKRTITSHDFKTVSTKRLNQQPAVTTVTPALSSGTTGETHKSVRKDDSVVVPWVLVYALSSVIPLLLLITLTAVIAVHRWNRARKDAKKKSATADSYCWVSSGYPAHLETQRDRIY